MWTWSGKAQALTLGRQSELLLKQNNLTDVGVIRRRASSSHGAWHYAASFPYVFPPLSPTLSFSNFIFTLFFLPISHLFSFLPIDRPSFPPFSLSSYQYLFFPCLCSALILDEAVQYVCFHAIMGSTVVFCHSLRHSLSTIVSQGRCYGACSNTRVATTLIRCLNSRSKDRY